MTDNLRIYQLDIEMFQGINFSLIRMRYEPPRLYRRVIYLSQAEMPDRVKLS